MTGHRAHNVPLKIKGELHINLTQETEMKRLPLIYLAGGTTVTKCFSEIPRQLYPVIINRKRDREEGGKTKGDQEGKEGHET